MPTKRTRLARPRSEVLPPILARFWAGEAPPAARASEEDGDHILRALYGLTGSSEEGERAYEGAHPHQAAWTRLVPHQLTAALPCRCRAG